MSTIIARVRAALTEHGNAALADELERCVQGLRDNMGLLFDHHDRLRKVMDEYIYTIQSRCQHQYWVLHKTDESISCRGCGVSVVNAEAYKWGKRMQQRHSLLYASDDGVFALNAACREVVFPLIKEIIDARKPEVREETLHRAGDSTEGGKAEGGAGS